jgi:HSP20 family protein
MAKNGKEVAVKKASEGNEPAAAPPPHMMSPMRSWEREIDRMFEEFPFLRFPRLSDIEPLRRLRESRLAAPTLDMYEEKNEVVVKAELPGMAKEDIDIRLSDSTLTLKGEKKKEEEVKEKDYYRCEREYGSFLRTVKLPAEVKADGAKATFKDGVLEVRLPKSDEAKKKEVHLSIK